MSSTYISKTFLFFSFIFLFSCQDTISSFNKKDPIEIEDRNNIFETTEVFDLSPTESFENTSIDLYTTQISKYNFLDKNLKKLKINNYQDQYNFRTPINVIYNDKNFYSINSKGDLLKFDTISGKLLDTYTIALKDSNKEPVSFALYNNDFIIGFKSGNVIRVNKSGKIIWVFNNKDLLNTPIKIYQDYLIILYAEKIIFLETLSGNIIFEKKYKSNNIIQSSGGKIKDYFNILFFILSNSEFNALDIFLFEDHKLNFDNIKLNTSLNNLNDQIHIYNNLLVYLDNGNIIHTYDINNGDFILNDFRINDSSSAILFNNIVISKGINIIEFYNIKNGNLFNKININKNINKNSMIIKALVINNKMHLFTNYGEIIILDNNLNIEKIINLKIKNINEIYSYQNKVFINTQKGITHIY